MRVRCATCMPRATPGCGGRWCPPASTAPRSCGRPASTTSWRCASTASSPRRKGCAANRRPTRSWPLPEDSASSRPLRRCSRTRSRGSPPAVPATSGTSSAWTGSARRSTYAGTGPMWWWPTSTTSWPSHDHASGVCRRALGDPRNGHRPRRLGPDRVGVRAVQRAHRAAWQPRRGRAARAAAVLDAPLQPEMHSARDAEAILVHSTRRSGRRVGAAMDHLVDGPAGVWTGIEGDSSYARFTVTAGLTEGETLRVVKFLAYGWSSQRSIPAVAAQVEAALTLARATGWDGLVAEQREYLDDYWSRADVDVDGDPEVQQAVRYALFQLLQASARAERRRGRSALASPHDPRRGAAGPAARPARRGVPVAHDQWRGVLRVLAGRHRRIPYRRGDRARRV